MNFALSYFVLCAGIKIHVSLVHGVDWSGATPFVMLWQDAIASVLLGAVTSQWKRAGLFFYIVLALHLVACVPLWILMATPLTMPLLNAADAALKDSVAHHVNAATLLPAAMTLGLAIVLPKSLRLE